MKIKLFYWAIFLLCCLLGSAKADTAATDSFEKISVELAAREIVAIDILAISQSSFTGIAITPESIQKNFHYKLELRNAGMNLYRKSLVEVLGGVSLTDTTENSDIRWAIIFYNAKMEALSTIYLDKVGNVGIVNGHSVRLSSPLFRRSLLAWLTTNFPLK